MKRQDIKLVKKGECRWEIPPVGGMRVPGLIFADDRLIADIKKEEEGSAVQVANVAHLPGIIKYSIAMPDIHQGYGFPIGGVAAFDADEGVISPGGVGYDINCGCRLMRTNLKSREVESKLPELLDALARDIPSGVGSTGRTKLSASEEKKVFVEGARWAVRHGYGLPEDLDRTESAGCLEGADPKAVSDRAIERGAKQLGTLGSGNHFLEVGVVDEIFDDEVAEAFGLWEGQLTVLIHSGSRGFGHQVCDDYIARMAKETPKLGFDLPDRQLVCVPVKSSLGEAYYAAMVCAANYAWANRQMLMHWTREVFLNVLHMSPSDLGMELVYDVAHNVAKMELHSVDGKKKVVCVHRKGATRAFPAGHSEVPEIYRAVGQPVLVPGDMGRRSYVMVGTDLAMNETFGSTCHGAGRVMSRAQAKKATKGRDIAGELKKRGILVRAASRATLVEEIPEAYKDVDIVADVVHKAGISKKVAALRPLGVIKG